MKNDMNAMNAAIEILANSVTRDMPDTVVGSMLNAMRYLAVLRDNPEASFRRNGWRIVPA